MAMDFLMLAKDIEHLGYEHYMQLAEATPAREISGIFKMLANEERRHYEIFDAMRNNDDRPRMDESEIKEFAKKTFQSLTGQFKTAGVPAIDHDDALKKALKMENNSIEFYTEMLNGPKFGADSDMAVLLYIIAQEKIHVGIISSLMDFFRHPGEWLENAEWRHIDEY